MAKYNFDEVIDRRNTSSSKWDVESGLLPMWIADMDFKACPEVISAFEKRIQHGVFGYNDVEDEFFDSYIRFYHDRHHLELKKDWMAFATGVVPIISSTVRKMTKEGDNVVVLSPVYNIFYNSIINNKRHILQVPLLFKNNSYEIDFDGLEKAFQKENTTMLIFCNPANPISKIWSREELAKVGALASRYHVLVLSDEIHCELVRPGKEYIPFISVNEVNRDNCIMAIAPSKSFNLAGIQSACMIVPNEEIRRKAVRQINTDEVAEPNSFACLAAITCFNEGREWLDELRKYLFDNRDFVKMYLKENIPQLTLVDGDATYLLWINIDGLNTDSKSFSEFLKKEAKLFVSSGDVYGGNGSHFIRLNVACPRSVLTDGLNRLKNGVDAFLKR